ncbi:MAG TPA: RIO1 family regulatory kinase/ATPase [Candidatus Limnocylindria bacterium]
MPPGDLFPRDWLVPGERHDELGILKTGKESEVYLVARSGGGRTCLLAEKRFRARDRRLFRDDYLYRGVWGEGPKREHRAMKRNTRFGHEFAQRMWIWNEWHTLTRMYEAGVTVPPPVDILDGGYRMAFIGDGDRAAPRLVETELGVDEAAHAWRALLDDVARMVDADIVHGDLSAYNVLWWHRRPVIIDFSQSVDVVTHPAAGMLVERDLRALAGYFTRRGVAVDVPDALRAVGADARRFTRQLS